LKLIVGIKNKYKAQHEVSPKRPTTQLNFIFLAEVINIAKQNTTNDFQDHAYFTVFNITKYWHIIQAQTAYTNY